MNVLPLAAPEVCECLAAHHFDRSAAAAIRGGSAEWNGTVQHLSANYGDAVAWGLVVCLLLTLGIVAGCILSVRLRPPGPRREHLLIDEVLRNEDELIEGRPRPEADGAQPWEKPGDWWKDGRA